MDNVHQNSHLLPSESTSVHKFIENMTGPKERGKKLNKIRLQSTCGRF